MGDLILARDSAAGGGWIQKMCWGQVDVVHEASALVNWRGRLRNDDEESDLAARNDLEAVDEWLGSIRSARAPATAEAYSREAARFLRWCWFERRIAMSDIRRADISAYRGFLTDPPAHWVMEADTGDDRRPRSLRRGTVGARQDSERWRPFVRGMSPKNAAYSLAIVIRLYDWLVDSGYLVRNPFSSERRAANTVKINRVTRSALPVSLLTEVLETIEGMDVSTELGMRRAERTRYLVTLMCVMGLRVGDFVGNTMDSFREVDGNWFWRGQRKGGLARGEREDQGKVGLPVPAAAMAAVRRYRESMGCDWPIGESPPFPMVSGVRRMEALGYKQVYRLIRDLFEKTHDRLKLDPKYAGTDMTALREGSCHWLRHTFVTMASDSSSLEIAKQLAGHADLRTTEGYRSVEHKALHSSSETVTKAYGLFPDD